LLAARSVQDNQWAVILSGAIIIVVTFANLMMGVMGRAIHADVTQLPVAESLQKIDAVYPILIRDLAPVGLKGIVIAGILAAVFSTYDSIGSTLSALITRDIYGRLLVKGRDDKHYLAVGRWLTPLIIFGSFGYVPFLLDEGMVFFYLSIVGAFVVPLMTVYLVGRFTPVHRASGAVGLAAGGIYGILAFVAPMLAIEHGIVLLPTWLMNGYTHGPMTFVVTTIAMFSVSAVLGWHKMDHELDKSADRNLWSIIASIILMAVGGVLTFYILW